MSANTGNSHLPKDRVFSANSTPAIPDSMFFASDFSLGAGMVVIQPSSGKVIVLNDPKRGWFLPKGRKDRGESLEQAALRETYEESGYRAEFLPLYVPSNAPSPSGGGPSLPTMAVLSTEPIYVTTFAWAARRRHSGNAGLPGVNGGEYITLWYVGQISEGATRELNTGMPDEAEYESHIVEYEEALGKLDEEGESVEGVVLEKAYRLWQSTVAHQARASKRLDNTLGPNFYL